MFEPYQTDELKALGALRDAERMVESGVAHEEAFIATRKAARARRKAPLRDED